LSVTSSDDQEGEWLSIRVVDTGIGIPEAEVDRVFERFYRASNVLDTFRGTGLGLSGVRQVVQLHGGVVTVQSAEGVGTTVTIRLPLRRP